MLNKEAIAVYAIIIACVSALVERDLDEELLEVSSQQFKSKNYNKHGTGG